MRALPVRRLGELIFSIQIGHGQLGLPMIIEAVGHFTFKSLHGVLVNIDGNSNRVSCIAQGPKKVIFIVGINKVCPDLDSAMKRARNVAATANAQRFDIKTPCKETGKCFDCKSPDTICCQFLITRYSRHKDRIHVILVNDTLGM